MYILHMICTYDMCIYNYIYTHIIHVLFIEISRQPKLGKKFPYEKENSYLPSQEMDCNGDLGVC